MSKYELIFVKIIKSFFTLNPDFNHNSDNLPIGISVSLENSGDFFDNNTKASIVQSFKTKPGSDIPFNIEIEFSAMFELNYSFSASQKNYLMKVVFPQIIFPYLREYIAELTRRAGFPPLLLNHNLFMSPEDMYEDGLEEDYDFNKWTH